MKFGFRVEIFGFRVENFGVWVGEKLSTRDGGLYQQPSAPRPAREPGSVPNPESRIPNPGSRTPRVLGTNYRVSCRNFGFRVGILGNGKKIIGVRVGKQPPARDDGLCQLLAPPRPDRGPEF